MDSPDSHKKIVQITRHYNRFFSYVKRISWEGGIHSGKGAYLWRRYRCPIFLQGNDSWEDLQSG